MKTPRDINGEELVKLLAKYDYSITKQTGSHIRITTQIKGEHHVTIPRHNPIKIGTLNNILNDISTYLKIDKRDLINGLFK